MHYVVGFVVGAVVAIFSPGLARKAKSWFSSEGKKAEGYVSAEVGKEVKKL